jgi:hypothetical protein
MRILFVLLLAVTTSTLSWAQEAFKGTLEYSYQLNAEGEEAGMMAAFMPEKMIIRYGDNQMATEMIGGMVADMMGRIIVNNGKSYVVNDAKKTIFEMSEEDMEEGQEQLENQEPARKIAGETMEVLGYTCHKYVLTIANDDGGKTEQVIWATDAFKAPQLSMPSQGSAPSIGFIGSGGVEGLPMRIEIATPGVEGGLIMEVIKLDNTSVEGSSFERPEGYAVKPISEMMKF